MFKDYQLYKVYKTPQSKIKKKKGTIFFHIYNIFSLLRY